MKSSGIAAAVLAVLCALTCAWATTPAGEEESREPCGWASPRGGVSLGWRVGDDLRALQERINRMFDDTFWGFGPRGSFSWGQPAISFYPRADVTETESEVIVRCDLPGMAKEKIDVSFEDGNLIISGNRELVEEEKKGTSWYEYERSFGSFERVIPIRAKIREEDISASYKNGVLTVRLPKVKEAVVPGKKIKIL